MHHRMKVHHFAIEVSDLEKSIAFYECMVGYHLEKRFQWGTERIAFLKLGSSRLELVQPERFVPRLSNYHLAFEVEDVKEVCDRLVGDGYSLEEGPFTWETGCKSVFFSGPDGELLEFIEAGSDKAESR